MCLTAYCNHPASFQCDNGQCLEPPGGNSLHCNGEFDCYDSSDENHCEVASKLKYYVILKINDRVQLCAN